MAKLLFPGSFDPPTLGHLDLIQRGLGFAEQLIVGVFHNPGKQGLLSVEERIALLRACLPEDPRLEVVSFAGLVVDYCRARGIQGVLRGLRDAQDFAYEKQMAGCNQALAPEVQTLFLAASPAHACIASSLIKDIARNRGDVSAFVPAPVAARLGELFA